MTRAALLALLALAGCTTATVSLPDGTNVSFQRFASDADLRLGEDGLHYSSSPSAMVQEQAQAILGQILGLALRGALPLPRSAPPTYQPQMLHMSEAGL